MSAIDLFNAATGGFIIGWWMRDIGRAVGALLDHLKSKDKEPKEQS